MSEIVLFLTRFTDFIFSVHCWDYRRYAASKAQATLQDEFDFTTKKIGDNFSNYSSWHQRSALIPLLYAHDPLKMKDVLNQGELPVTTLFICVEFELMKSAFYTDPADQSIWFYYRWLVEQSTY